MENTNVNEFGRYLGGWSHLIEGEGGKAQEVRKQLAERLNVRGTLSMTTSVVQGYVNTKESNRPYILTTRKPGYNNAILVRDHGNDLYVSWKTFQAPVLNKVNIAIIAGVLAPMLTLAIRGTDSLTRVIAFVIGFFLAFVLLIVGIFIITVTKEEPVPFTYSFRKNLIISFVIGPILLLLSLGLVIWIINVIRPALPIFTLANFIIYLVILFLLIEACLFLGAFFSGNRFKFLIKFPTIFDADDAIAMSLLVHKSLLHTLDQVGIDTSQLRLHNETLQSRLGESV